MRRVALVATLVAVTTLPACSAGGNGTPYVIDDCTRRPLDGRSVARVWDEALLDAIRRDVPAPTVHARNLFHVSAAMWDAWAAYDRVADGYFVREKHEADDVRAAREAAISYAAYRVLLHRYSYAAGLEHTFAELAATMEGLCYRVDYTRTDGDDPASLGNRIARRVIAHGRNDGAHERLRYADPDYKPANAPLVVANREIEMSDPSKWQPLALAQVVAQNGLPIPGRVQRFVGSHWGKVRGFALPAARSWVTIDPGSPPRHGEKAFLDEALTVLRYSSWLDGRDGVTIDIGPGARGGSSLGANDGRGHERNPVSGEPYEPNVVARGDFARALTEFWADGPDSETPPGHWNTIANDVSDALDAPLRIGGAGPAVDRLEWDVKLFFALNGAVHDAAIAAWGAKRQYDSARPISIVRYLAARGELPVVPGLVERVSPTTNRPGARHAGLRVGELAVRAWRGSPKDPKTQEAGVGWIRGAEWVPYQLPTFVSPAFAGFVSGHSTFSRAAAELMTGFTGSGSFPGGLLEWRVEPRTFRNERGPERPLTLQWATYADAADDAGISRLLGGIHVPSDDFAGRRVGFDCGRAAWKLAQRYYDGSAR